MYFSVNTFLISSFNLSGSAHIAANTPRISSEVSDTPLLNAFGLDLSMSVKKTNLNSMLTFIMISQW